MPKRILYSFVTLLMAAGLSVATPTAASAVPASQTAVSAGTASTALAPALTKRKKKKVLRVAASKKGAPYRYGAAGPRAFDCSGYTQWVHKKVGVSIPRTSSQQAAATRRVSRAAATRGDLVFFHNGGRVYHVGIYAGKNRIWHASKPGTPVGKARIWTSSVFFGKVR